MPGDRARAEETLAAYDVESAPPPPAPALAAHGARCEDLPEFRAVVQPFSVTPPAA
jgi:hypothetical protein